MESAIDKHLQCPRTLSRRVADDYKPPFPMYAARAGEEMSQVVMAYFGVQYHGSEMRSRALEALRKIVADFGLDDGPAHYDLTTHPDNEGYDNLIAVAYWRDPAAHHRWLASPSVSEWWNSDERLKDGIGYFREIAAPRAEQFETLYAFTDNFPGVGAIMDGVSGEVQEHGYWGSIRDRFPISQTDWMRPNGTLEVVHGKPELSGRVIVRGHDNVALIRSGQEWREAGEDERQLYLGEIEPTLRAGMDFLRDHGHDYGCYSNRYVQSIDLDGNLQDESYNIGHWRSLDKLERWAESHPTHLRIFVTFFRVVAGLSKLRLYHEVSVFDAKNQVYEYINCHARTGMMRDAVIQSR
ncbi:aliphatic aldoxime dehydratase [Paraburkholderia heleia]|uniref:aliphatic aldoxime dehydratase n=1 Tax=Paraburkholderia heleia TaxID=634127 RepID=UPI0005A80C9B|nr:phenylacetaldoxime dehydratase family protein [Paraburkholderia heleia]